ncbi:IS21-like element helper ATPase IstB [Parendozoicomonas sp. Alg238-R29]|uniref:IS21-like element helper ATPase IstB n=1 Tax=Parendozoicomonas sp. Alg238-R29 TaxID=2993446 RepID=UPI00248E3EC5|nr:IS21-like element helper ATPase IstB [Parendozoicomonas sp. Alg238-R29]
MSTQQLINEVRELRLSGFLQALIRMLEIPDQMKLPFEDRLSLLLQAERLEREQRKQARLRRSAQIKQNTAYIEDVDYVAKRGFDRSAVESLCRCDWVTRNQFLLITGSTGTGKSWLACALANEAIRLGLSVLYKRFGLLLEELDIARKDGSLPKLRSHLTKVKLLVLDDWAMAPLTDTGRQDLLDLIEDRTGNGALIITSQLPVSEWHTYIEEPTLADAIMDRLIHRSHRLALSGSSMRKKYTQNQT